MYLAFLLFLRIIFIPAGMSEIKTISPFRKTYAPGVGLPRSHLLLTITNLMKYSAVPGYLTLSKNNNKLWNLLERTVGKYLLLEP